MAISPDHMQFVNIRRLAMVRAAFALLACADEQHPILTIMNAEPGCRDAGGLTAHQEASMLAAINSDQFSAQAAADVVSDIIATNHADDELAVDAARIDLVRTLRRVQRHTRVDEERASVVLSGTSLQEKHAAAAEAIFRLREIGRMVGPLVELLDTQASVAGHASSHAVAAE